MYDKTQLMRGSLGGCILKIIEQHMTYDYEIFMNTKEAGWTNVTEGTLYLISLWLEKSHYIRAKKRDSPLGPRRKYYQTIAEGRVYLRDFYTKWNKLAKAIDKLFEGGVNDSR